MAGNRQYRHPEGDLDRRLAEEVLAYSGSASDIVYKPYHREFPDHIDVIRRVPNTDCLEGLIGPIAWSDMRTIIRDVYEDVCSGVGEFP